MKNRKVNILKKRMVSILLAVVLTVNAACLIANVIILRQIKAMYPHTDVLEIGKQNPADAAIRVATVLHRDGWKNAEAITVSEFDYSYSPDGGYYIDVGVIPENAHFMEQTYDITPKKVFFSVDRNPFLTKEAYVGLPSLNHIHTVLLWMQERLYADWFRSCEGAYLISYEGTVKAERIHTNPASRNYSVYILTESGAREVTSPQAVTGETYYWFEVIVDRTVREVFVDVEDFT